MLKTPIAVRILAAIPNVLAMSVALRVSYTCAARRHHEPAWLLAEIYICEPSSLSPSDKIVRHARYGATTRSTGLSRGVVIFAAHRGIGARAPCRFAGRGRPSPQGLRGTGSGARKQTAARRQQFAVWPAS